MPQHVINCPVHGQPMGKVNKNGIELDMCGAGCVFFDPNELNTFLNAATGSFQGQPVPANHQFFPQIPQGQHVRDPHAYVTHGFGPGYTHKRRRRGHGSGIFGGGSFGSFESGSFGS